MLTRGQQVRPQHHQVRDEGSVAPCGDGRSEQLEPTDPLIGETADRVAGSVQQVHASVDSAVGPGSCGR